MIGGFAAFLGSVADISGYSLKDWFENQKQDSLKEENLKKPIIDTTKIIPDTLQENN